MGDSEVEGTKVEGMDERMEEARDDAFMQELSAERHHEQETELPEQQHARRLMQELKRKREERGGGSKKASVPALFAQRMKEKGLE